MRTLTRWEPFRGATTLQDQVNRLFNDVLERKGEESSLTAWAPSVDIYETEHELVIKADLPEVDPKDLDIRVENNILTIRGERKFEKQVSEENYLRVERAYGSFARSFTPEERGSQAEADQGQRRDSGDGRGGRRKVILAESRS